MTSARPRSFSASIRFVSTTSNPASRRFALAIDVIPGFMGCARVAVSADSTSSSPRSAACSPSPRRPPPSARGYYGADLQLAAKERRRVSGQTERTAGRRTPRGQSLQLLSLELPRREAADVNVKLVDARIVAVTSELNLELQLVALHGKGTDGAGRADTRPRPTCGRDVWKGASLIGPLRGLPRGGPARRACGNLEHAASGRVVSTGEPAQCHRSDAGVRQPQDPVEGPPVCHPLDGKRGRGRLVVEGEQR